MSGDAWTSLLLLGTGRAAAAPPPPHPLLDSYWQALDWTQREVAALQGLALVVAAGNAGAVPLGGAIVPAAAPVETALACTAAAADRLRRMLAGEQVACLSEWLALAARGGRRAAHRDLPALLAHGTQHLAVRAAIGRVLGERGRWLARGEERWHWALGSATELGDHVWSTGTPVERVAWLRQRQARDPAAAVTALAATWDDETGERREQLLPAITEVPHAAAADWLERVALRDRRAAVRGLAQKALLRLPQSALAVRARQRAAPLLQVAGLLKKRLVVTLPSTFDAAWQADGVDEKPPVGVGPRAHWARQLLGMVPLSHWLATFHCSAEQLFTWNRDEDSRDVLRLAFVDAVRLEPTPDVAVAFTNAVVLGDQWPKEAPPRAPFVRDLLAGSSTAAAAAVRAAIAECFPADVLFAELLTHGPIEAPSAAAVADGLLTLLQRGDVTRSDAAALAAHVQPASVPRLLAAIAALPALNTALETCAQTLEFRQTLHQAFAVPASA